MCFVLGVNLGLSATLMQLWLSSRTLQKNLGSDLLIGKKSSSSFMRLRTGRTSCIAIERAMYSASVVLSAISVFSLLRQKIGHPAYEMKNPVQDKTTSGFADVSVVHPPAKSTSTWHSSPKLEWSRSRICHSSVNTCSFDDATN